MGEHEHHEEMTHRAREQRSHAREQRVLAVEIRKKSRSVQGAKVAREPVPRQQGDLRQKANQLLERSRELRTKSDALLLREEVVESGLRHSAGSSKHRASKPHHVHTSSKRH